MNLVSRIRVGVCHVPMEELYHFGVVPW